MAEAKFYAYVHRRADTGAVFYVGKGMGYRSHDRSNRNKHWNHIVAKHGHTVEIVARFESESEAFAHERALIAKYRAAGVVLVNMTDGGEGVCGKVVTPEQRAKLSAALKGRKPTPEELAAVLAAIAARGPMTEEHRARISAAKVGRTAWNRGATMSMEERLRRGWPAEKKAGGESKPRPPLSAEHRAKVSAALKGRPKAPFTDEHRARMSESKQRYWAERRQSIA
jgi:hypothetical protein